jgi:RNA polymerase sigma factor (sigma-70 family)
MPDDVDLLRRYSDEGAEDAFREVVQRRFGLVYAVALRQVGNDAHLARDVAQHVFVELARQAGSLSRGKVVSGWLYRTARFTAIDMVRAERRRRNREQEAHAMHESSTNPVSDHDWENLRPVLDDALSELNERDRDAITLRIFEQQSFGEIGRMLHLSESAARMRFDRALEKLRVRLRRYGVTSTTTGLGLALANQVVASVPAGLPAVVAGEALAGVKLAGVVAVAGKLSLMSTTKSIGGIAAAFAITAVSIGLYQKQQATQVGNSIADTKLEIEAVRGHNAALTRQLQTLSSTPPLSLPKNSGATQAPATANTDAVTDSEIERMNSAYEANRRLRTANPEYQQLFERAHRARARLEYAALYKALNLTAAQIEQFESLIADRMWSQVDRDAATTALGLKPSDPAIKEFTARADRDFRDRLETLLGASGYERFREMEKLAEVREMIGHVAGAVYFTATPLTARQGEFLAEIIARHDANFNAPPEGWRFDSIDWTRVLAEARPRLSAAQFEALEGVAANARWRAENIRLLNEARQKR